MGLYSAYLPPQLYESEKQMTRKEAINKFANAARDKGYFTSGGIEAIVMGLEALELLKFEDEPSHIVIGDRAYKLKEVFTALANQGYAVDKVK